MLQFGNGLNLWNPGFWQLDRVFRRLLHMYYHKRISIYRHTFRISIYCHFRISIYRHTFEVLTVNWNSKIWWSIEIWDANLTGQLIFLTIWLRLRSVLRIHFEYVKMWHQNVMPKSKLQSKKIRLRLAPPPQHPRDRHPRDKTRFPRLRRGTRVTARVSRWLSAWQRCYGADVCSSLKSIMC